MHTYDCIVAGAGISGLSTAYELYQRNADVLVIEARDTVGGSIRSERTAGGFVLENGPNTVTSRDPRLDEHFESLGITEQRVVADRTGARRYILLNGELTLIPTAPPDFVRSPIISTPAKLRMLAEPLLPRARTADESVEMFFSRRLGPEPTHHLIDPFVSGVYAGDPHELSIQATFPTLWEAEQEYGSIILGMIRGASKKRAQKAEKGPRKRSEMLSFQNGLITWPQAIARALGPERVWLNTRASGLRPASSGTGWELTVQRNGAAETLTARRVVLAMPAHTVAALVAPLDELAAQALRAIDYPPMSVVHLGYRRADVAHPLDGFGMLCPSREQRPILGTLWPSSLFPGRAPDDMVLTTTFVGGARKPELARQDREDLLDTVAREQQAIIGTKADPVFASVSYWEQAISQYNAGHTQRTAALERLETMLHGLHIIGNFRDGVSVEKCWHKGHELGRSLPLGR